MYIEPSELFKSLPNSSQPSTSNTSEEQNPGFQGLQHEVLIRTTLIEIDKSQGGAAPLIDSQLSKGPGVAIMTLDTGSSGNATLYLGANGEGGGEILAVDCGINRGKFREALKELGLHHTSSDLNLHQLRELRASPNSLWFDHLLLTHFHSDHFNEGSARMCKELGVTVHVSPEAIEDLRARAAHSNTAAKQLDAIEELAAAKLLSLFPSESTRQIGSWLVTSTKAMHDAPATAYSLTYSSVSAFHSGDTGAYTSVMRRLAERAHVILGDANYDLSLIDSVARPPGTNERTKGPLGHMGNHQNGSLLQGISRGANTNNLQAFFLMHRSSRSNQGEPATICSMVRSGWDTRIAGRHAPAIRVVERGPRLLGILTEDRTLILPDRRNPAGFLVCAFGETGLSEQLGRDVMPELTKEFRARMEALGKLVSASDLRARTRDQNATIRWRVPSEIALIDSNVPERLRLVAPVTICRDTTNGIVQVSVNKEELQLNPANARLARTLSNVFGPRHPEGNGKLFTISQAGLIKSSVGVPPNLLEEIAEIVELQLYQGISREIEAHEETRVRWCANGRLALLMTDDVLFERSHLARLVCLYNRERQRLYIDSFSAAVTTEYFALDRTTSLINELDTYVNSLAADAREGEINWRLQSNPDGRATLKHSGKFKFKGPEMFKIGELIERNLIWG
jgi:phosphoribosyl 1,2-cyclic phosphodiesterase